MKNIKRLLPSVSISLLLAGCIGVSAFAETDYSTGTPWLDPEIIGNVTEDTDVSLKDNFVLGINKEGYLNAKIPDGYPYGGTIRDAALILNQEKVALFSEMDSSSSHDEELCMNYYDLLLDWDTRNTLGMKPILSDIETIQSIGSLSELTAYLTETDPVEVFAELLTVGVEVDLIDSSARKIGIGEPDLLLGDSNYYRQETQLGTIILEAYSDLVIKALQKAGFTADEAENMLKDSLELETKLAEVVYSSQEKNSPDHISKSYNPSTVAEADALCGDYPLAAQLKNHNLLAEDCIVVNPAVLEMLAELYTEDNLEALKAYLTIRGMKSELSSLDRECYEWVTEASNKINSTQGMVEDEVYAANAVEALLGWSMSHIYCDQYVTEEEKAELHKVIDECIDAYREMLSEETFISAETIAYAQKKLDNLTVRCLYPDDWAPYSMDAITFRSAEEGGTIQEAEKAVERFYLEKNARELNEQVDREIWPDGIFPGTMNCFYNPSDNSINILAAFARGEFYNSEMTIEQILGTIGGVIGHEISHAFDSSGAQYDEVGNFKNWWTEEDYAAFSEKNQKIADYFSSITPWEGQEIVGETLTGEACADMGGIACALHIASGMDDFDYEAFFNAFAKLWLNVETPAFTIYRITQDRHPLGYLRENVTVQQFEKFYEVYGIEEGDGMYLAKEDSILVW